ncbi:MAG TPA: LLM class flavin-dependent oxidoreductase [Candidatus Binataceae bacterium]|nr:LLM class flavin-dependent oxidoreductase [Candidatus Binataceae bacterium]
MKFILHLGPVIPGTMEEREKLRPIAHRTDRTQQMLDEMVEMAELAEATGFEILTFSEHHFFTDGLIAGANPTPHILHLASHTKKIKIGPLGYVLPTWDPIRLATDVAWADQMTRGRVVAGFARGVFPRWVNVLGQRFAVEPSVQGGDAELHNREVSQELFEVIKAAWKDEAFSFKGKYYQVPTPADGVPWPACDVAERYGAPGEVDERGLVRKISVVPKPYQKPHPLLLQAMTLTRDTIAWTAREGIVPMIFLPFPDMAIDGARVYQDEAAKAGRQLKLGESVGLARIVSLSNDRSQASALAEQGIMGLLALYHSRFYPNIPTSVEPMMQAGVAFVGTPDDVRRQLAAVRSQLNPEYFLVFCDQGLLPIDEVRRQVEMFAELMPEFR